MRKILSGASALGLALVVAAPAIGQVQPGFGPRPGAGFGPGEVPLPGDLSPGLGQPAQPAAPGGVTGQVDPTVPGLDDGAPGLAPGRLPGIQPLPRPGEGLGLPAPGQASPGMPGGPPPATLGGPGFGMPNDPALGGAQDPTLGGIAPGLAPRPRPAAAEEPEPEEGPDDLAEPETEAVLPDPTADPAAPAAAAEEPVLDAEAPEATASPGDPAGLAPDREAADAEMPEGAAPAEPGTDATDGTEADEPMPDAVDGTEAEEPMPDAADADATGETMAVDDRFATLEALDAVLVAAGADQIAPFLGEARPLRGGDGAPALILVGMAAMPEDEDAVAAADDAEMPGLAGAGTDVAVLQGSVDGNPVYTFPLPLPAAAAPGEAGMTAFLDGDGMEEAEPSAVRVHNAGRSFLVVLVPIGEEEEPALSAGDLVERLEAEGLGVVAPVEEGLVLRRGEVEGRPVLAFAGEALEDREALPE